MDDRPIWSVVFWYSHKIDLTSEIVVSTNTSYFAFNSDKQDSVGSGSSSATVTLCGTSGLQMFSN